MKGKTITVFGVLVLGISLFGCGTSNGASQDKGSPSKTEKKVNSSHKDKKKSSQSSSEVSSQSESVVSSALKSDSSSHNNGSGIDDTGFKSRNFPANMQGTWYDWDENSNSVKTVTFTANKWSMQSEQPFTYFAYDTDVRTAQDRAALQNPDKGDRNKESKWAGYSELSVTKFPISQSGQPVKVVNLQGWYQSAGAGTYYYVTDPNINGKATQVLTEAEGAGIWVSLHYYRSQALAKQQEGQELPTDSKRIE